MISLGIRFLGLLLSLIGYMLFLERKGIHIAFAPVLTVSGIGIAMFFAGLLNIMSVTVLAIFLGGLFCAVFSLRTFHAKVYPLPRTFPEIIPLGFFLLLSVFFFLRLHSEHLLDYDNFSHWLLVIRDMLNTGHLPNFASTQIEFQGYPTGCAGFIFYICKILGDREGIMLFGQAILLIACLCVFWAFVEKSYLISGIVISLASIYLLVGNIPITNLSVDTLLSLLGIASFATVLFYRKTPKAASLCLCILSSFLILVKNSGIFFLAFHGLLLLILVVFQAVLEKRKFPWKDCLSLAGLTIIVPASVFYLWDRHVDYSFYAGEVSKHSMTIANYTIVFGEKSPEDVRAILDAFLQRISTPSGWEVALLLTLAGLYLAGFLRRRIRRNGNTELWYFLWSAFTYLCYLAGILVMYLISMPYEEAVSLGSFDRYLATITMYLVGIGVIYLLREISLSSRKVPPAAILAPLVLCFLLIPHKGAVSNLFSGTNNYSGTTRGTLQQLHADYDIGDGARYYVIGDWEWGYLYWVSRYEFWSTDVIVREEPNAEEFPDLLSDFDYIIVIKESEESDRFLTDAGLPLGERVYALEEYR